MSLYSKLYFSNKTTILFLKKLYIVCTTLILMDSNIINVWPYNTKTIKVIMLMYQKYLFKKKITCISTPPSSSKIQIFKYANKSQNMIFINKKIILHNKISL
jgi:hypothetical protein